MKMLFLTPETCRVNSDGGLEVGWLPLVTVILHLLTLVVLLKQRCFLCKKGGKGSIVLNGWSKVGCVDRMARLGCV